MPQIPSDVTELFYIKNNFTEFINHKGPERVRKIFEGLKEHQEAYQILMEAYSYIEKKGVDGLRMANPKDAEAIAQYQMLASSKDILEYVVGMLANVATYQDPKIQFDMEPMPPASEMI